MPSAMPETTLHPEYYCIGPVIENHIEALQQIVIDYCGDLFINTSHILINR